MKLWVNGVEFEVQPAISLRHLLMERNIPIDGVAVAVDQQVVPRSRQEHCILVEGQRVEVIRAVGGG